MSDSFDFKKANKISTGHSILIQIIWWGGIALILLLVYGALTGQLAGDSDKSCDVYQDSSGEWVSSCDDGYPGTGR
jgi:hypothetical protein